MDGAPTGRSDCATIPGVKGSRFQRELAASQWPLSCAQLGALGVTRGRYRGPRFRQVQYGHYAPAVEDPTNLTAAQRILDATPLLVPGAAFGGWAAAYVHGVDWLDGRTVQQKHIPIDLISDRLRRRSTKAITYRQAPLSAADFTDISGLPVTVPLRTAYDGARWSPSVEEAVVFLDAMLAFQEVGLEALQTYVEDRAGRGIEQARQAMSLCRPGVASPWESRLRYCCQIHAGLPEPMINVPLFDAADGSFLGIPDLFDPDAALAMEFDGEQHRTRHQHRRDNLREEGLERANVTVIRVDSLDLMHDRRALVRRILDGRQRGLRRDRRFDRWTLTEPGWWLARHARR